MGQPVMREDKTYDGILMSKGKANEEVIINWLKSKGREIIDFREFKLAQRIDVDCGIESKDGQIVLAEIKSDNYIKESGNLLFEFNRINHYVKNKWFYLGWGWRSPAQNLIIRNPKTGEIFIFDFLDLRTFVGKYIGDVGSKLKINITETDKQKTTFNYLIPFEDIKKYRLNYKKDVVL